VKVEMQLHGLDGVLDTLRSLPPEVVSKRGGPALAALRKGARVIDKQRKANLQAVTSNATSDGEARSTGFLAKNLTTTRGKVPGGTKGERVVLRIKNKTYPGTKTTTAQAARLLEYGSSQQPAEPWVRPAFLSRAQEAIDTTERELVAGIDKLVRKLAARNKGR
jgi:HK97 gp10 family phage protein